MIEDKNVNVVDKRIWEAGLVADILKHLESEIHADADAEGIFSISDDMRVDLVETFKLYSKLDIKNHLNAPVGSDHNGEVLEARVKILKSADEINVINPRYIYRLFVAQNGNIILRYA